MPEPDQNLPPPEELQFRRAQPIGPDVKSCIVCKQPIAGDYYNANGNILCSQCKVRIEAHQQPPPHTSLLRAAIYGGAAALAGCAIYATVVIVTHLAIGIVAILIGYMVGKSVRYASRGLGGRPQQILAVALTYFAITASYILVSVYQTSKARSAAATNQVTSPSAKTPEPRVVTEPRMPTGNAILILLALAAAAPFMALFDTSNLIYGLIDLFIIFIGLQQAWRLTARREIVITGPYLASS
jgi:uncharacterized membrane protein